MFNQFIARWVLVLILAFQVGIAPAVLAADTSGLNTTDYGSVRNEVVRSLQEPALQTLEAASQLFTPSTQTGAIAELLDRDPYFLRSQEWGAQSNTQTRPFTRFSSTQTPAGLEIAIPGARNTWRINQALEAVLETPEWIFLKPAAHNLALSDLQGVFAVSISDLYAAAQDRESAPIFFFPLPGQGWGNRIQAQEIPHLDLVVFESANGDRLPVHKQDIKRVINIGRLNYHLAIQEQLNRAYLRLSHANDQTLAPLRNQIQALAQALKGGLSQEQAAQGAYASGESEFGRILRTASQAALPGQEWLPERGSTAYFGLYYAGTWTSASAFNLIKSHGNSFTAYASEGESEGTSSLSASDRIVHSAKILGVAFVGTVLLKYTFLRTESNRRAEQYREAGIRNPHMRVTLDLYAHTLTVLGLAGNIWPANIMEQIMDRMNLAENAKFRRLFNETFGRTRATSSATPVNARTLIDGVVIIGAVDTLGVIIQYTYWNPPLGRFVGKLLEPFWPEARSIMERAFAASNESSSNYNVIEFIRNGVTYVLVGAYSYAHDVQDNATNEGTRIVRDQMRDEGMDPNLPANAPEIERRVNLYVREKLAQQGLPNEKAFWYDANSIYYRVLSVFGYATPEAVSESEGAQTRVGSEQYLALRRVGLVGRALNIAIAQLEEQKRLGEDSFNSEAYALLKAAQSRFSLLRHFLDKPSDFLTPSGLLSVVREFRRVRAEIVPLTQDAAQADLNFSQHPWTLADNNQAAIHAYRKAFLGLIGRSDAPASEVSNTGSQVQHRFDPMVYGGAFERWQLRKAWNRAEARLLAETQVSITDYLENGSRENTALLNRWQELYRRELHRVITLYPDYSERELIERVTERAEQKLRDKLSTENPEASGLNRYLDQLSNLDRNRVIETLKADFFASEYIELTQNQEQVPALSPAQPGRFQWLRQTKLVQKSEAVTMGLRFFESAFADTRYERGLWSMLSRDYVPLLEDMVVAGFTRNLRKLPYTLTFGYLIGANIWLSAQPYALMPLQSLIAGATVAGMWVTTMRIMKKLGWKPGLSRTKMVAFALFGSCLTFTTPVWLRLFEPAYMDLLGWSYAHGRELLERAVDGVHTAGQACSSLLTRR